MNILYVTQTFPPEPGPTTRPLGQAVQLRRRGHDVTVLTAMPSAPLGEVFPAYRGAIAMREVVGGVRVLRVPARPTRNRVYAERVVSWASFALSAALAGGVLPRPDAVVASVPNFGTDLAALAIARARGAAYVLELRDLPPENLALVGMDPGAPLPRSLGAWVDAHSRRADLVAVTGTGARCALLDRVPELGPEQVVVLPHGIDALGGDVAPVDLGPRWDLEVLYAGSFSAYYAVPTLVAAARELARRNARVRLHLLGTGREREGLEEELRRDPCGAVVLHPPVPPEDVPAWLAAADVLVSPYCTSQPVRTLDRYMNTKLVQYLGAGRPVLAVETQDVAGSLLAEIGAGSAVRPDPGLIADQLVAWAADEALRGRMGCAGRRWAEQSGTREHTVRPFAEALEELVGVRRRRARPRRG